METYISFLLFPVQFPSLRQDTQTKFHGQLIEKRPWPEVKPSTSTYLIFAANSNVLLQLHSIKWLTNFWARCKLGMKVILVHSQYKLSTPAYSNTNLFLQTEISSKVNMCCIKKLHSCFFLKCVIWNKVRKQG